MPNAGTNGQVYLRLRGSKGKGNSRKAVATKWVQLNDKPLERWVQYAAAACRAVCESSVPSGQYDSHAVMCVVERRGVGISSA